MNVRRAIDRTWIWVAACALVVAVAPAYADGGKDPQPSTMPAQQTARSGEDQGNTNRQHAEDTYAMAWKDVEKAKQEMSDADSLRKGTGKDALQQGKKKFDSATKRLRKAVDRFEYATQLDTTYHEAWNMLGYCLRKLGDTQKSFDAYWVCLRLNPDYSPAHEDLGEAYLIADNLPKARAELTWLERHGATEAKELATSVSAYELAHPQAAATDSTAAPASK